MPASDLRIDKGKWGGVVPAVEVVAVAVAAPGAPASGTWIGSHSCAAHVATANKERTL